MSDHTTPSTKGRTLLDQLDTLSSSDLRALPTDDLRRLEAMLYHWSSLAACELHDRIRASREEESE